MCLIDYQIGRQIRNVTHNNNDDTTVPVILQPNKDRVSLIISAGKDTLPVDVILQSPSSSELLQFVLFDGAWQMSLFLKDHGDVVTWSVEVGPRNDSFITISEGIVPDSALQPLPIRP